jgi:hypothetical protein
MLERRNAVRWKMVLPVKVSIEKYTHLADTVDITSSGAQLGALRTQLQPGAIIHLQRGSKKAKFRIAWIRQLAPNEIRAGVESVDPVENFWGVDLSDREGKPKNGMRTFLSVLSHSSKSARLRR